MKNNKKLLLKQLQAKFSNLLQLESLEPPSEGWIKTIRKSLGMTEAQLASRAVVSQPTINSLENSEIDKTIKLASLEKIASALDCRLVYFLIPNEPLEKKIEKQAYKKAKEKIETINHSMNIEAQAVENKDFYIEEYKSNLLKGNWKKLWEEN